MSLGGILLCITGTILLDRMEIFYNFYCIISLNCSEHCLIQAMSWSANFYNESYITSIIIYLNMFAGSEAMFADLGHFSYAAIQVKLLFKIKNMMTSP